MIIWDVGFFLKDQDTRTMEHITNELSFCPWHALDIYLNNSYKIFQWFITVFIFSNASIINLVIIKDLTIFFLYFVPLCIFMLLLKINKIEEGEYLLLKHV